MRADEWLARHSIAYRNWSWHRIGLRIARERDVATNATSQPSRAERIEWRAFWLCEVFPAGAAGALERTLAELEEKAYGLRSRRDSAAARVRGRSGSWGGMYWHPLAWAKPRSRYPHIEGYEIEIPPFIDHVRLSLHSPIPGLHLLVGCFVFEEEARSRPTELLLRDYTTTSERHGSSYSVWDSDAHKGLAIRQLRFEAKEAGARWLRDVVGAKGLFASATLDRGRYPAVEFWTTRVAAPLDHEGPDETREYMRPLDLDHAPHVWTAETLPGLLLADAPTDNPSLPWTTEPSHSLLLIAREEELYADLDWESLHRGSRDHWSELGYLEEDATSLAAANGLYRSVIVYERQLGRLNDDLLALQVGSVRQAARTFRRLERDFLRLSSDALPFATALRAERGHLARAFRYYRGTDYVSRNPEIKETWFDSVVSTASTA